MDNKKLKEKLEKEIKKTKIYKEKEEKIKEKKKIKQEIKELRRQRSKTYKFFITIKEKLWKILDEI